MKVKKHSNQAKKTSIPIKDITFDLDGGIKNQKADEVIEADEIDEDDDIDIEHQGSDDEGEGEGDGEGEESELEEKLDNSPVKSEQNKTPDSPSIEKYHIKPKDAEDSEDDEVYSNKDADN
jgi:hypothetical protein